MSREQNVRIFEENQRLLASGRYPSAARTLYYDLNQLAALPVQAARGQTIIAVTDEDSITAGQRLRAEHPGARLAVLNFASALHPGGGYVRGSIAQEECLCRCSDLYRELLRFPQYYAAHSADEPRYSDRMMLHEDITVFRDAWYRPCEPWRVALLTVAAPNQRNGAMPDAYAVFRRRAGLLLRVLAANNYTHIVLGAWGCGAFRNDPDIVGRAFQDTLREAPFFEQVLFAVYDPAPEQPNFSTFKRLFAS